jgi:hypothetical protein
MLANARRFECTTGGHNKFYEIEEPQQFRTSPSQATDEWVFNVEYAAIGNSPQSYTYVRHWEGSAWQLYRKKIAEKLGKGYVEVTPARVPTRPVRVPRARPEPPPCPHDDLQRTGNKYKCRACKSVVEFGEAQTEPEVQVFVKVRRLINFKKKKAA